MDAQYKMIAKKAHLFAKESPQEEANEMLTTMSKLKEQLSKVGEYFMLHHVAGGATILPGSGFYLHGYPWMHP